MSTKLNTVRFSGSRLADLREERVPTLEECRTVVQIAADLL
jgi:hypothetical protein